MPIIVFWKHFWIFSVFYLDILGVFVDMLWAGKKYVCCSTSIMLYAHEF